MRAHTTQTPICCDVIGCGYEAVRKADFDKHMWVHILELYTADVKKQYRYQAFGCDYRTLSKSDFQKHFMIHLRAKPYQCMVPGCGYASWSTVLLDTHMKVHISLKPTSTSLQPWTSSKLTQTLIKHDAHEQPLYSELHSGDLFTCTVHGCDYASSSLNEFEAHLLTHMVAKSNRCVVSGCNFNCSSLHRLYDHMGLHTVNDLHQCKVHGCSFEGVSFSHTSHLREHMRVHMGFKQYMCNVHGCGFNTKGEMILKEHMWTRHATSKPYSCTMPGCDCKTARIRDILKHIRAHGDEKPY